MLEGLLALFHPRSPLLILRDVFDIAVVAYAVYRLLLLLRGTRAMQVGLGLALVVLVYVVAQRAHLVTAYTLLDRFLASFLLLVVVIFQADIRRALMRVGNRPFLLRWRKDEETTAVEEVISSCALLAQRRIGALIVFEREASLDDFVAQGTVLDAEVSRELLYTVFLPGYENPLHDGAVIIKNARVWKAGAFLPLTANPSLDRTLGTRHRAALGISEETDAVVVIVSEERGQVSLCFNGNIVRGLDSQSLRQALYGLFYTKRRAAALLKGLQSRDRDRDRGEREHESSRPAGAPHRERASVLPPPPEAGRGEALKSAHRLAEAARAERRADDTARERPARPSPERRGTGAGAAGGAGVGGAGPSRSIAPPAPGRGSSAGPEDDGPDSTSKRPSNPKGA